MALKPDRHLLQTDVSYFMNATADPGIVVVYDTAGSGTALDDANAAVIAPTGGASGTDPAGVLLTEVVNLDLTRQHLNQHKDQVQVGSKVTLLKKGFVVTDRIADSGPIVGRRVFYDINGHFVMTNPESSITPEGAPNSADPYRNSVGHYGSVKDSDGYAKVFVNID